MKINRILFVACLLVGFLCGVSINPTWKALIVSLLLNLAMVAAATWADYRRWKAANQ